VADVVHTIRLRGPWRCEPVARSVRLPDGSAVERTDALPPPGRVKMPAAWSDALGDDFRGRVRLRRNFGAPTGIEPGMQVWLRFSEVDLPARAWLQDHYLGEVGVRGARIEVTDRLAQRNELTVEVDRPVDSPGKAAATSPAVIGEVRLEICG